MKKKTVGRLHFLLKSTVHASENAKNPWREIFQVEKSGGGEKLSGMEEYTPLQNCRHDKYYRIIQYQL